MINYALTGKMNDEPIIYIDNARFRHPCCNYYVGLKPGTIAQMGGIDEVEKMKGVLNITHMCGVGTVIGDTNALERICLRIHVVGSNAEELAHTLVKISDTLQIISTEGDDMQLEHLDFERCLSAIHNTTTF